MRYLPHTEAEVREMLARAGAKDFDDLFATVPAAARLGRPLGLPPALDEAALMAHMEDLAARNPATSSLSFLGAGIYDHHVPPAVDQLLLRSEFYTAYTPYQPELSQGTLQAIFEYQTIVSEILGLPVANASMYDGASAAAEAVLMAQRLTGKKGVVVARSLHPEYTETIRAYVHGGAAPVAEVPWRADGRLDLGALERAVNADTAAVVVGYPNLLGVVDDLRPIVALARAKGALAVTATWEPFALSMLEPPGALGAAIAVGEGQPLGIPPQLGGPGVGLFACGAEHVRQIPGRLVGETVDAAGTRGFVLTLATREQHIRRAKATSNICTNHGLMALAVTIRMALLGRAGFRGVGDLCLSRAEYLKAALGKAGLALVFSAPTFNEFAVRLKKDAQTVSDQLAKQGVLAGVPLGRFYPELGDCLLVAVTERHAKADLDRLAAALASFAI